MKQITGLILFIGLIFSVAVAQRTVSEKSTSENQIPSERQGTPGEQALRGEIPFSFTDDRFQPDARKTRRLSPTVLPEQPKSPEKKQQIGIARELTPPLRLSTDSTGFDVEGGKIYLLSVVSEGAKSMRLKFENLNLPEGARVFAFPLENKGEFYSVTRENGLAEDRSFWTPPIEGDGVVIEVFVPVNNKIPVQNFFRITEVSHAFIGSREMPLFPPGNCHNEVPAAYSDIAKAVGYLRFIVAGTEYICTGTLLNAASNNFAPYLLTANHCFSTQASAQSLRVYWNYNSGDTPPFGTAFTDGANLLSTSPQSDFTLVRLTGTVPSGLQYMGWDGGTAAGNMSIFGIHHPSGSHKRISYGTTSPLTTGCPFGIPSSCENFIRTYWNSGVTEGGSSGSEIFRSEGGFQYLIGTLWGGFSSCNAPAEPDWYGRFSITYHKTSTYLADAACNYSISSPSNTFSAGGGTGSITASTGSACYFSAIVTNPTTIQTFSNASAISIADRAGNTSTPGLGSLYPSTINVAGLSGLVTRVRVTVNGLTHTYPDDLDFLLVAPNGQQVLLMSDVGGGNDVSNTNLTIDQSGQNLLADESTLVSGIYRPSNYAGLNSVDLGGTDNFPSPASGQNTFDNTLHFFNGISPNGAWRLYVVDDEAGDIGTINGGWNLELATSGTSWLNITSGGSGYGSGTINYSVAPNPVGQPARTGTITVAGQTHTVFQNAGGTTSFKRPFDYDGDGKTDVSIFRPSVGEWWINRSSTLQTVAAQFGASTDKITPGDFTGDGKTDIAFWRPSNGFWFILRSEDGSFFSFPFGTNGDIPAPADYDNDGKTDVAVFRPSNSTWYILRSSDSLTVIQTFGIAGDVPVTADYDGDGRSDIAIYRPSVGEWWIQRSSLGITAFRFGNSTDKPVAGDFTGDGRSDAVFWRPSNGFWFILRSEDFSFYSVPFGTSGDTPLSGDFDGDGKFDLAVFRPSSSTWYVQRTTSGSMIQQFGLGSDKPTPSAYIP